METVPRETAADPLHPGLDALFGELGRQEIAWSLLRGETRLEGGGGDVDLLVARPDFARLSRIAERIGFARLPAWGYGSHAFFLTYDAQTGRWLKVDVVTELAFGPSFALRTDAAADCLRRRKRIDERAIFSLADDDAFWSLVLHCCLDKGAVSAEEAARLQELASAGRVPAPLVRSVAPVSPSGWRAERIVEAVERGDWTGLVRLGDELAASWIRRRPGARARAVAGRLARRADTLRRVVRPRGLIVALVGPEAVAAQLARDLASSAAIPVRKLSAGDRRGGLRIRRLRGGSLVLLVASSLDELPTGRQSRGRRRIQARLEALSSPGPDLVIRLHPGPASAGEDGSGALPSALVVHVDASLGRNDLLRAASTSIWRRLVTRWTGSDPRSTADR